MKATNKNPKVRQLPGNSPNDPGADTIGGASPLNDRSLLSNPGRILFVLPVPAHQGQTLYRPQCPLSERFCELLRQKTLTQSDVELIKLIGFEIRTKEIRL